MFHLDEYVGLPIDHPASFRRYLLERLIGPAGITRHHLLDGEREPSARRRARRAGAGGARRSTSPSSASARTAIWPSTIRRPTSRPTRPYSSSHSTRRAGASRWARAGSPRWRTCRAQAISMSVRQILEPREILCVVPDARKAEAVQACGRRRGDAGGARVDPADASRHHALPRSRRRRRCWRRRRAARCCESDDDEARVARACSTCRSTALPASTSTPRTSPPNRSTALDRASARDRRHALPADADHRPRSTHFARNARAARPVSADPAIAGMHMEGPYLSPEDGPRGAHPRRHVIRAERSTTSSVARSPPTAGSCW